MKIIDAESLVLPLSELIKMSLYSVESSACELLKNAEKAETSPLCKWALSQLNLNNEIAEKTGSHACQDCGQAVLFVDVGQDVHINGSLTDALNKGVEWGYKAARKSVANCIDRQNTGSNTPAVIHYNVVSGDNLKIKFMAKGAGSENMSKLYMLTPSDGIDGIVKSVVSCVTDAGANPCPPIVIGVGIGGTMEKCALLSKYALTRKTGEKNSIKAYADLEEKLLVEVNKTGIGTQGFGGVITALAVHVEGCPTHIGMLPVAVNIQCHSVRHGELIF